MSLDQLTPTERRLYDMLSDGEPHTKEELQTCMSDTLTGQQVMQVHLVNMRPKIRSRGLGVLTQTIKGKLHYRMVQFISRST